MSGRGHKRQHSPYSEGKYARLSARTQRAAIRKHVALCPSEEPFISGAVEPYPIHKFHLNNLPLYESAGKRINWHWVQMEELMRNRYRASEEEITRYHELYKGKIQYMKGVRPELHTWQLHEAFDKYQDTLVTKRSEHVMFILRTIDNI